MKIKKMKFDPATAFEAHDGTILAAPVIPPEMQAPFIHQYGYLMNNGAMAGHSHPTDEIYIVFSGSGYIIQGGKNKQLRAGDVVSVPHDVWHTMLCTDKDEAPFLWAALWWEPVEGSTKTEEIDVKRFDKATAYRDHKDTIYADKVVPISMATPFSHQYGYLDDGGTMELHKHPASEVYIVYSGTGTVVIDDEQMEIGPGDVIEIPPNTMHTIISKPNEPLLWAALWWDTLT